ncbi:MAG: HAD family hydrolase [Patescibacteria group bacterium]
MKRCKPALFLDRDGVIFREVDHLWRVDHAKFIPGVFSALRKAQKKYRLVVITNQAGIAKGLYTLSDYQILNSWMLRQFRRHRVRIAGVFFCPHHPTGRIARYRKVCDCRKPKAGLFLKAAKKLQLDLQQSWSIGDKTSDTLAAKRAGCKTIIVRTGYAGRDLLYLTKPLHTVHTIFEAVYFLSTVKVS